MKWLILGAVLVAACGGGSKAAPRYTDPATIRDKLAICDSYRESKPAELTPGATAGGRCTIGNTVALISIGDTRSTDTLISYCLQIVRGDNWSVSTTDEQIAEKIVTALGGQSSKVGC